MTGFQRALACAALIVTGMAAAAEPQRVEIPAGGRSSSPAPLVGYLFRPPGAGPHPAVVMMHGCGGAYAKSGKLNSRHQMWGDLLSERGYAALMVDSFTSRGLREICTIKLSERVLKEADRVGDAHAALAFLRGLPEVAPNDIGLLGWSHGGGVALGAITQKPSIDGFRAAVAFYPGCSTRARRADTFHPYAPTLVLIGRSDNWTPAAPCEALVAAVAARGEPMSIVTYAGAYHDFDSPLLTGSRVRQDVPNGVNPGQGVTIAGNPEAREDAIKRVSAFFALHLH
jgi:dienelactone hydrolase